MNYYDIVKEGGFIDRLNTICVDLPANQGTDYTGPVSGNRIVGCGGCYNSEPLTCRYSYHGREIEHNGRDATLGFRIVLRHIN